jgi:peptidoglycan/LPS O-acetylase OafA/YrhL
VENELMRSAGRTPPKHEEYIARRHFGSLDGLRCASILAVIWHHTTDGVPWYPASHKGFLGVDMFFVISGFLIVTLLLRERERTGRISLRQFYARRTLRIFPAYYAVLVSLSLALLVFAPGANMVAPFFSELPYYLSYTANWIPLQTMMGISWSLAAEEQFYLLWPPIEKWLRRHSLLVLMLVIGVSQLVNFRVIDAWLLDVAGLDYDELPIMQSTFTPISLGVLLAHLLHSRRGFERVAPWFSHRAAGPVSLLVLVLLCNYPGNITGWPRLLIHMSMASLLLSCVVREDHDLAWLLRWTPVRRIGVISYGMYLYHLFGRHVAVAALERATLTWPGSLFVLTLVLTIAAAELSYRFYETPFLRLRLRFAALPRASRL